MGSLHRERPHGRWTVYARKQTPCTVLDNVRQGSPLGPCAKSSFEVRSCVPWQDASADSFLSDNALFTQVTTHALYLVFVARYLHPLRAKLGALQAVPREQGGGEGQGKSQAVPGELPRRGHW